VRSAPARVLLIEDEAAIRDAVTTALTDAGYLVRGQADGTLLHDLAEEFRPDLAILDITLPGPDGLIVARRLRARVHALLRRSGRLRSVTIEAGDLVLDESASAAWRAGRPLDLTATELRLLAYLLARRGRTVSKAELLTQVWGYGSYDPNLVEVRISALRRKLEASGPRIIHTVHSHGYTIRLPGAAFS
jgi:DNA-binding response OmpR family regulator